jgi:hypothetical protein
VHASGPGRAWTVDETHPYMLFLQRWWLTGQAVYRGYNVLSLDTDLHLAVNPLELLNGVAYADWPLIASDDLWLPLIAARAPQRSRVRAIMQLDSDCL